MTHTTIRALAATAAALALGAVPQAAQAWNNRGHMMVAAVAWGKMAPETKTRVHALLKQNPMYATWVAGVPSASRPVTAFLRAATWPDVIKGNRCEGRNPPITPPQDRVWTGPLSQICYVDDGSEPPSDPSAARNLGYADMLQHKYWHYKDLPIVATGPNQPDPPDPNAASQIKAFRDALAGGTEAQKAYDLPWLVHMIGDVHQPLHAASRFLDGVADNGGNGVKVCVGSGACTLSRGQTLHSFWDGALGSDGNLKTIRDEAARLCNATAVKQKLCDPKIPGADGVTDVDAWLSDSRTLAKDFAYGTQVGPRTDKAWPVDAAYRTDAARVARSQVALAGARLAKLLDDAL